MGAVFDNVVRPVLGVALAPLEEIVAPALLEDAKVQATLVEEEVVTPPPIEECRGGGNAQEAEATALLWRSVLRRHHWRTSWHCHHWRKC